jgi:hypothetical protein
MIFYGSAGDAELATALIVGRFTDFTSGQPGASGLPAREHNEKVEEWIACRDRLTQQLIENLRTGVLVARGILNGGHPDEPRIEIPRERWAFLELDVSRAEARGSGTTVKELRLYAASRREHAAHKAARRGSPAGFRRWYREYVRLCEQEGRKPNREDDHVAALEKFPNISRSVVRGTRSELAPESWHKRGRPK